MDTVTFDIPLFLRLLEFAREDANHDVDLHFVAENAVALSSTKNVLDMDDYESIVSVLGTESLGIKRGYTMLSETRKILEGKDPKVVFKYTKKLKEDEEFDISDNPGEDMRLDKAIDLVRKRFGMQRFDALADIILPVLSDRSNRRARMDFLKRVRLAKR